MYFRDSSRNLFIQRDDLDNLCDFGSQGWKMLKVTGDLQTHEKIVNVVIVPSSAPFTYVPPVFRREATSSSVLSDSPPFPG